jgi:hypothetical protein
LTLKRTFHLFTYARTPTEKRIGIYTSAFFHLFNTSKNKVVITCIDITCSDAVCSDASFGITNIVIALNDAKCFDAMLGITIFGK